MTSTCTTFPKNWQFLKKSVDTENHAPCCRGDKEPKKIFPATHWNRLLNNWEQTRSKVACLHASERHYRRHGKLHSDTNSDFKFRFSGKFCFRKCIHISNPIQTWCEALSAFGPKCKKCRPEMATENFDLDHRSLQFFTMQIFSCLKNFPPRRYSEG